MEFYELMDIGMIVLFGCSWPMNVIKSYKTRTQREKSDLFDLDFSGIYLRRSVKNRFGPATRSSFDMKDPRAGPA